MAINILKRTRADTTALWSAWSTTTDIPPYASTTLVEYKVQDYASITMDQLTAGHIDTDAEGKAFWTGTGIFDIIMTAVNGNVKCEYESGRIVGTQYADVYLGALQSTVQAAVALLTQKPLSEAQVNTSVEQRELLKKQQLLVERQTKGFDDDAKQKLLKQTLESWGIAYSVAQDAQSIPDTIKVNVIDSIMFNAMNNLGIDKTINPLNES